MEIKRSWLAVTWVTLADIIGTSVLTFSGVARDLGIVLTVVFIAGLFPLSLHVSCLMSRTRQLLQIIDGDSAKLDSMGSIAGKALDSKRAETCVFATVYGYTLLGQGSYLLVLGTSLQRMLPESGMCIYEAVGITCLVLVMPSFLWRELGGTVWLCLANTVVIVAVIIVALVSIGESNASESGHAHAFASDLTFWTGMGAMTNVIYSFAGQWMYFEVMDEMAVPSDFPRVFYVAGPFMVVTYLLVALLSLEFGATSSDLIGSMAGGWPLQLTSTLLFVHVLIVYLVHSVVLARFGHQMLWEDSNERTKASYAKHGSCGLFMLAFGFVVSNAVPFFSQLLGLIGGFLSGPINFVLPIALFFAARRRALALVPLAAVNGVERSESSAVPLRGGVVAGDVSASSRTLSLGSSCEDAGNPDCLRRREQIRSLCHIGPVDVALIFVTLTLTVMTMIFGVWDVILDIANKSKQFGGPFSCHRL